MVHNVYAKPFMLRRSVEAILAKDRRRKITRDPLSAQRGQELIFRSPPLCNI